MTKEILLAVDGEPPHRDVGLNFCNPHHPQYPQVVRLREAAAEALAEKSDWDPNEAGWIALALTVMQSAPDFTMEEVAAALGGVADALQATPVGTDVPGCSLYRDLQQIRVVRYTVRQLGASAYSVRPQGLGVPV